MTTTAAEHKAGHAVEKEKVEKRRALGRGLESLLPGPRVVNPVRPAVSPAAGGGVDAGTRAGAPAPHVPESSGAAGGQQIPPHRFAQGRNDKVGVRNDGVQGYPLEGTIRAEVETQPGSMTSNEELTESPLLAKEARSGAPTASTPPTAGQPGAAVPTDVPTQDETITILAQAESRIPSNLVVNLALELIDKNPFQTRYVDDDDALEELADSIKANGVVQPILVRPAEEDGRYILVLGERRLHASKKAGKETIPAMVRRLSLQQAAEMTIIENLQREDLSALEQAEAFRVLSKEFSLTQSQIGERVGLSRESVANYMRLLKLPRDVMQLLAEKKISFGEAKELLKLNGDDQISKAAIYAVKKGLSLDQIESMVMSMNGLLDPFPGMPGEVKKKSSGARWVDPNVRAAQLEMERILGVRVKIRDRKGKGRIVIEYSTVDDYERVVGMLRGKG